MFGIVVSDNGGQTRHPPTNFVIDRNVIKPYSSDDSSRISSTGISVSGVKNSWITNNIIFHSGNNYDLVISEPKGVTSSVICRDNYHPDGTRLVPKDGQLKPIPGGLSDRSAEFAGMRLTHAVDPAGPAKDKNFAGAPGDYAAAADFLYIYTGDGTKHQWKRIAMGDY